MRAKAAVDWLGKPGLRPSLAGAVDASQLRVFRTVLFVSDVPPTLGDLLIENLVAEVGLAGEE